MAVAAVPGRGCTLDSCRAGHGHARRHWAAWPLWRAAAASPSTASPDALGQLQLGTDIPVSIKTVPLAGCDTALTLVVPDIDAGGGGWGGCALVPVSLCE